jgi:hypothetical protein
MIRVTAENDKLVFNQNAEAAGAGAGAVAS